MSMQIHLSYRERIAGLFILFSALCVIAFIVGAAIQNRWLEPRFKYHTHVVRGDGLRSGSPVLLSGLEIGEVGRLAIMDDNRIDVELLIRERHVHRIRVGTIAEVKRLLGIGEKRIHLTSKQHSNSLLPPGAILPANEPIDILDAVSNVDLGLYISTIDRAVGAMEIMLGKLEEENRLARMMEAFDQMGPTMERMNSLLVKIEKPLAELISDPNLKQTFAGAGRLFNDPHTRDAMRTVVTTFEPERMGVLIERMEKVFARFDKFIEEENHLSRTLAGADKLLNDGRLDKTLDAVSELTDAKKLEKLIDNLALLADELADVGPEIPTMSKELISTLREAVIVLRALQKTWLLDEEAEEVLKELRRKTLKKSE